MFSKRTNLVLASLMLALLTVNFFLTRPTTYHRGGACVYAIVESPKDGSPMGVSCDTLSFVERLIAERIEGEK